MSSPDGPVIRKETLRIHAGLLFDGVELHGPSSVLIDDGRIVELSRDTGVRSPGDVDFGPGSCLLPGFVDAHTHLCFDASVDPIATVTSLTDSELLEVMRASALRGLSAGVTTMRDLGDRNYLAVHLRDEFAEAPGTGPEILAAGPPITTKGGHCHFLGGVADGEDEVRRAVKERATRGCDLVKVMASGGNMTPGSKPHESQYTLDELRTIVGEAHAYGLPVAAHAHGPQAIADSIAAGVDTLEHATFMTEDGVSPDPDLLAKIADGVVFVDPTLGSLPGTGSASPAVIRRQMRIVEVFREMTAAGARMAFGSDAGIYPAKPHGVLPWSAVQGVTLLGMSPIEAMRSLTSVPAAACRVEDRKGKLRTGMDADLVVVLGNPTEDVARLTEVHAVYRAGRRVR